MVNIFKARKSAVLADTLQKQTKQACDKPIITEKEARKLLRKETSDAMESIDLMRTIGHMAYLSNALLDGVKVPQNGKDMVK